MTRRDVMKTGLAAAALGAAANFEWVLPALAQGEVMVPFTDSHVNPPFNAESGAGSPACSTRARMSSVVHAEGSVLHDAALRPSRSRSGRVSAEGRRPRQHAAGAVARRAQEDGQRGADQRLRVLGQPPPGAGPDRQRPLDRRAAQDRARQGRPQAERARDRVLRRRSRQGRRQLPRHQLTTSSSSTAAASSATRRCRPIARRSSPMRSTASR